MGNAGLRNPKVSKGQSLVELALILPVLLLLALGVVDFARAIQFNNILVSISREGANLISRSSASYPPQNIIAVLDKTTAPMRMDTNGMVYITRIVGRAGAGGVDAIVLEQYRASATATPAISGDTSLPSRVWNGCSTGGTSWDPGTGSCKCLTYWQGSGTCSPPAVTPTANLPMTLTVGEEVYAVEALYNYNVIVHYVMNTGPKLYSLTVL